MCVCLSLLPEWVTPGATSGTVRSVTPPFSGIPSTWGPGVKTRVEVSFSRVTLFQDRRGHPYSSSSWSLFS